jgi:hypothetical protein
MIFMSIQVTAEIITQSCFANSHQRLRALNKMNNRLLEICFVFRAQVHIKTNNP